MILMNNSFSFTECTKTFLLCKLLCSLDYSPTLDYKEVLITILSTTYADYQRYFLCKFFPFFSVVLLTKTTRGVLYCLGKKILRSRRKLLFLEKYSQFQMKILKSRGKFSILGENSQLKGKILNSRKNS